MPNPPESATAVGTRATAADLIRDGATALSPSEQFRDEILRRLDASRRQGLDRPQALRALFPRTVLPVATYDDLVTALVAGAHLLFFGPSGAGKTNLAKELWSIFPKEVWAVEGCPVLDHPLSVATDAGAARFPPCPICQRRFAPGGNSAEFAPSRVDPTKVPAVRVRLREGFGFARLQGSSEVFPDYLTGNVNLRKLEEIGDPMSPLVLEPGKLLQANRGLLLIDEIGKLPLGTQNVLLQALQEGSVTPAKSRESFPGNFVAVCTSNLSDLDNINDPLSDRLTSLHIEYNPRHRDNVEIVRLGRSETSPAYLPEILLDAGVRVIETWRLKMSDDNPDIGEVGSNRTLLDVAARTGAVAVLAGRPAPTEEDVRTGLVHAMRGRIRARSGDSFRQNERRVTEFVAEYLPPALKRSGGVYWCRYFRGPLHGSRPEAEGLIAEGRRLKDDAELQAKAAADPALFPRFQSLVGYVQARESPKAPTTPFAATLSVFRLLEEHSLFSCDEEADDDAAL